MTSPFDTPELFSTRVAEGNVSPSVAISAVAHCAACGLFLLGLQRMPHRIESPSMQHFSVRILETANLEKRTAVRYTGRGLDGQPAVSVSSKASAPGMRAEASRQASQKTPALQTLIQPDVPPVVMPQARVPTAVLWSTDKVASKLLIPPPPAPAVKVQRPSLTPPNHEIAVTDVEISATLTPALIPTVPASTTAPIVTAERKPGEAIPQTTATLSTAPTSSRVVSISELESTHGPVAVPPANMVGGGSNADAATLGGGVRGNATSTGSKGDSDAGGDKAGASGQGGSHGGSQAGAQGGSQAGSQPGTSRQSSDGSGEGSGIAGGAGTSDSGILPDASVTRIRRPRDGQFGVVVTGGSLTDEYPESTDVWNGRVMYSVYLPMEQGKSWILQYSLPPATQGPANGRPDAPWPYDMVRPNLPASDYSVDAIMVHGMVTAAGHFEHLVVVFPHDLPQAKLVLSALQQWQFRPSRQNGQAAAIEILLIIPGQDE